MALIQTSLIWVAYAVALVILLAIASLFVFTYQKPGDRSVGVTIVCIFTLSALLATVLLLPVDVALVSSTVKSSLGARKDWATQNKVDEIVHQLEIVYYTLYSLDAILCLLVIPFTYFLYEEYDEVEAEEGNQTLANRLWGAFKYTLVFVALVIVLFLVGFFLPVSKPRKGETPDFDYFKHLLYENHGERALTFALGLLITIGTIIYVLYTGPGLALLPVTLIKSAPAVSVPTLAANTSAELEENRERQHQLEARNQGRETMEPGDRRELDQLLQDERVLTRRERLAAESRGENRNFLIRAWHKIEAIFRPLKLIGGFLLLIISLIIFASMLITGIDKAKNSICKTHCGYILGHVYIFQPINALFVLTSKVFPIDYIFFLLLVVFLYSASVVGIAVIGIRFLWLSIFKISKGRTSPQAILMATVILTLLVLALNYSVANMIAPQYATFGPQTFCDRPTLPGEQPDCSTAHSKVRPCSETAENPAAREVCTPSVVSTFLNRIVINFPFFGLITFWAQFAFLAAFIVTFLTTLVRTPKLSTDDLDADLEEEQEEGLLQSTGRRFNASWQDITGRARAKNPAPSHQQNYGTTSSEQ